MWPLVCAIHDRLASDPEIAAAVAIYRGAPAIFTIDPAPFDADMPLIVISAPVASAPDDTYCGNARDITRDARLHWPSAGSVEPIERAAERVRQLLHRWRPNLAPNYGVTSSSASGPVTLPTDSEAYSRVVPWRARVTDGATIV